MKRMSFLALGFAAVAVLAACQSAGSGTANDVDLRPTNPPATEAGEEVNSVAAPAEVDIEFTLTTSSSEGLAFVGTGGEISGQTNPTLKANPGDTVRITLINGDDVQHDLAVDEFQVNTGLVDHKGNKGTITFTVSEAGEYVYFCSIPGHREAGMWGTIVVGAPEPQAATGQPISRSPANVPEPVGARGPELVQVDLVAEEVVGQLADGATFNYFTFNGSVPGPMIRARVGDTIELTLQNETESTLAHSIDLHAVNGPGGGAVYTQTAPGDSHTFTFKALSPGLFVYHCATPSVAHHIANGMYGLILIEPEGGLPPVDKEFYVMQGEIYTEQDYGSKGHLDFSHEAMLDEQPEYFVFNGAVAALTTDDLSLKAEVGDSVRVYFGVGGPNFTSSFHVIGEIFDQVYNLASVTTPAMTNVQTTLVPPGGATIVEFTLDVPGNYILVDHALSRLERGLVGFLVAEGADQPDVFHEGPAE